MIESYRPDWCERCFTHLAMPSYTQLFGYTVRKPLICPVCADEAERKRAA